MTSDDHKTTGHTTLTKLFKTLFLSFTCITIFQTFSASHSLAGGGDDFNPVQYEELNRQQQIPIDPELQQKQNPINIQQQQIPPDIQRQLEKAFDSSPENNKQSPIDEPSIQQTENTRPRPATLNWITPKSIHQNQDHRIIAIVSKNADLTRWASEHSFDINNNHIQTENIEWSVNYQMSLSTGYPNTSLQQQPESSRLSGDQALVWSWSYTPKTLGEQIIRFNISQDIADQQPQVIQYFDQTVSITKKSAFSGTRIWIVAILIFSLIFIMIYFLRWRKKQNAPLSIFNKTGNFSSQSSSESQNLADLVIHDAAVESIHHDRLGMKPLVTGLARFLQNRHTKPPVTMAITGDWGSGKSSVMHMLKTKLFAARFTPIWFNAWHHYEEEHLYGALLETIRQNAIPPIWRPSGWWFRLKLLGRRAWRNPVITLISLILLIFLWYTNIDISAIFRNPEHLSFWKISALVSLIGFVTTLLQGLAPFGINPTQIVKTLSNSIRLTSLEADPGFRYRIHRYLADVTWALGDRTLVIFIDDLDRCPADRILKVLECVNFLCSPPCQSHIVLGMALDKILPGISHSFSDIVENALNEDPNAEENKEVRRIRCKNEMLAYAKHYLEKLINIEVHVPVVDPDNMQKIIGRQDQDRKDLKSTADLINTFLKMLDEWIVPLCALSIILIGLWNITPNLPRFNKHENNENSSQTNTINTDIQNNPTTGDIFARITDTNVPTENTSIIPIPSIKPSSNNQTFFTNIPSWSILIGLLVLMLPGIFFIKRKGRLDDTPEFLKALKIWSPVLLYENNTPRHFKRSINQLRLLAMRMQSLSLKPELVQQYQKNIQQIICLKALREIPGDSQDMIKYIQDSKNTISIQSLKKYFKEIWRQDASTELCKRLVKAITEHDRAYGNQWPNTHDQKVFDELMSGITLR